MPTQDDPRKRFLSSLRSEFTKPAASNRASRSWASGSGVRPSGKPPSAPGGPIRGLGGSAASRQSPPRPQSGPTPLPCPFCGGRAVTERAWADAISVVCTQCGAVGLHQTARGRQALVQAWNRRKSRVNLQQKSALQPCPFCASRQLSQGGRGNAIITCQTCGMMTSFATADTRATAVRRWNRRV